MKLKRGVCGAFLRGQLDPGALVCLLELRKVLNDCGTVLDVGCGSSSPLHWFEAGRAVGIDGHQPSLDQARQNGTHHDFICGDIRQLDKQFSAGQFDCCIALDVIEHLEKADGFKLMEAMEKVARRKAIFFTPNGFLRQTHATQDDLQEHLSGWERKEMEHRGYRVIGMLGPKSWRGEYHRIRLWPRALWSLTAFIAHFVWTRFRPQSSAAILCVKELSR